MDRHEEALIRSFIAPSRRARWLESLASPKRRRRFLDRLNHCNDIDPRFASPLSSTVDVVAALRSHGAPEICYVLSAIAEIDGQELPLAEAIEKAELGGWGTLIGCVPGRLAYYYDECGERRLVLTRAVA